MIDIEELNKEKEKRLHESLKKVDSEAEYVKKTPNVRGLMSANSQIVIQFGNAIWSKQQADFLNSYVDAQNKLCRERRKIDPNYNPYI